MTESEWATTRGRIWAAAADRMEEQLAPVSDVLFAAAELAPGERVLDVGCGLGSTTRRAALAVAPSGSVTGVDVSADLQERARREPADGAPIEWVLGDAQQFDLGADRFDVVISRFGVMFFADPIAAFANLARSTRPEGRLVVAVWQRREHSPVMQHNIGVAAAAAARLGVELAFPPPDVGPCSLGTPDVVQHVLGGAGWRDITIRDHTLAMYAAGPGTVADIVDTSMTIGGLGAALAGQPDDLVAAVREALIDDYGRLHDGTGVPLDGAISILLARR